MVVFRCSQLPRVVGRRRALTPLNRQIETKNGLWAGRLQNSASPESHNAERSTLICHAGRADHSVRRHESKDCKCRDRDERSNRVISKKSCLRRAFVSRLNSVLLGHVFAVPRPAVKRRAFAVVNACFSVNPYQAMTSARRLRVSRLLRRASRGR